MQRIRAVHPRPDQAHHMPYAPAVRVEGPADILFISGSTSSPLYHQHPHVAGEHCHPIDIETQTHRAMAGMVAVLAEYFGDWKPASTTICINALSTPGARVELDMIAVRPKG